MDELIQTYEELLSKKQDRLRKQIADSDIEREGLQDSEENRTKLAVMEAEVKILSGIIRDLEHLE